MREVCQSFDKEGWSLAFGRDVSAGLELGVEDHMAQSQNPNPAIPLVWGLGPGRNSGLCSPSRPRLKCGVWMGCFHTHRCLSGCWHDPGQPPTDPLSPGHTRVGSTVPGTRPAPTPAYKVLRARPLRTWNPTWQKPDDGQALSGSWSRCRLGRGTEKWRSLWYKKTQGWA